VDVKFATATAGEFTTRHNSTPTHFSFTRDKHLSLAVGSDSFRVTLVSASVIQMFSGSEDAELVALKLNPIVVKLRPADPKEAYFQELWRLRWVLAGLAALATVHTPHTVLSAMEGTRRPRGDTTAAKDAEGDRREERWKRSRKAED
jgi:hypothetical protein